MKLNPVKYETTYVVGDDSGYHFTILAAKDEEWGWNASVQMTSFGHKTAETAVKQLQHAAEHFLRQLKELEETQSS